MLIQNITGHSTICTIAPPYSAPSTQPAVSTVATSPSGMARSPGGNRSPTSAMLTGTIAPAPSACTARPPISA